jgi:hypothetical protein
VSEALGSAGVVGYVDHKDVPGTNWIGEGVIHNGVTHDEELFVTKECTAVGKYNHLPIWYFASIVIYRSISRNDPCK